MTAAAKNPGVRIQSARISLATADPRNRRHGPSLVRQMPLEMVFQHLYNNELFRLSWGAKNAHGEEWEKLEAEFKARLERMKREALRSGWLKPRRIYGYWPAQSDGDDLVAV